MVKIKNSFNQSKRKKEEKEKKDFFASEKGGILEAKKVFSALTGGWRTNKPVVDLTKCVGCGICTEFCPEASLELKEKKGQKKVDVDYDFCKGCGICSQVCPFKAIKMEKNN